MSSHSQLDLSERRTRGAVLDELVALAEEIPISEKAQELNEVGDLPTQYILNSAI